jgi:hypothetical protein
MGHLEGSTCSRTEWNLPFYIRREERSYQIGNENSESEIVPKNNKLNTILINSLNADIGNQFDKISKQQLGIEEQQGVIKVKKENIQSEQSLKLLFSIYIGGLAFFSIYSR